MKKANDYGAIVDGSATISESLTKIYQVDPKMGYSTKELVKYGIEQNLIPKNTVIVDENTLVIDSSKANMVDKLFSVGFRVGHSIKVDNREFLNKERSSYHNYFIVKSSSNSRLNDFIEDTTEEKIVEAGRSADGTLFKIKDNTHADAVLKKVRRAANDLGVLVETFNFSKVVQSKFQKAGACHKLF